MPTTTPSAPRDYPSYAPATRAHLVGERPIKSVLFRCDHDSRAGIGTLTEVHWTYAFQYLRATGQSVEGVRWEEKYGGPFSGSASFASWRRCTRSGLYRIVVGSSEALVLEELKPAARRVSTLGRDRDAVVAELERMLATFPSDRRAGEVVEVDGAHGVRTTLYAGLVETALATAAAVPA